MRITDIAQGRTTPAGPGRTAAAGPGIGQWRTYDVADGLADPEVGRPIVQDREGNLWFATLKGVTRYRPSVPAPFVVVIPHPLTPSLSPNAPMRSRSTPLTRRGGTGLSSGQR